MPRCVQGHEWQAAETELAACPVCGMPDHGEAADNVLIHAAADSEPAISSSAADSLPSVPGYDVIFELGRGDMGAVYEAWQIDVQRRVALRMIHTGIEPTVEDYRRLRHEASIVARLQHPNIVHIHDIGENHGQPYLALELVEGGSLAQRFAGQPQPPTDAAGLAQTLARAVQAVHDRGIVHGNLKPANILLQPAEREGECAAEHEAPRTLTGMIPKIADFGLPRMAQPGAGGTVSYQAPERAAGGAAGPLVDVYALGAILYELLTGRPPFAAPTPLETAAQAASLEPVSPRRLQPLVPRDLETICLKCLRKQPRDRYASARELADDLGRLLAGQHIEARPSSWLEHGVRWRRANPIAAGLGGLAAAGCLALVVLAWLWSVDRAERRAATSERVNNLLHTAASKQAEARAGSNPTAWTDALALVDQADALLEAGPADQDLHDRAAAQRDMLAREQANAARAAAEAKRDRVLLDRLEALRLDAGMLEGRRISFQGGFQKLCDLFRDDGIDLFELPRAEAARRIHARPGRRPLCEHLLYLSTYAPTAEKRDRLLDVLRLADPQPVRDQLLADLATHDMKALKSWATADHAGLSSTVLTTLGMALAKLGEPELGAEMLRRLQDGCPANFWAHYNLGVLAVQAEPPRWREAECCFRTAVALRPDTAAALNNLGIALAGLGRVDQSLRLFRRAAQLRPDLLPLQYNLRAARNQ